MRAVFARFLHSKLAFTYDPGCDLYTCPQGTPLPFDRLLRAPRVVVYRVAAATCCASPAGVNGPLCQLRE